MKKITVHLMGAKFRTKRELERLIRRDMNIFLCAAKHLNVLFYRDIISSKKVRNFTEYFFSSTPSFLYHHLLHFFSVQHRNFSQFFTLTLTFRNRSRTTRSLLAMFHTLKT
jgi:hypothetical protein